MEAPQEVREITPDNFFYFNPITENSQFTLLFEIHKKFLISYSNLRLSPISIVFLEY